jgi:pilus assembly protein CpaB
MKNRRITLIVAVVLAVATGLLTLRYLASLNKQSQVQAVQMNPVVIASVNIPARTKIKPQMLTKVMRVASSIEPGSVVDPATVSGDIALTTIAQGSLITQSKIGVPGVIGVTARLRPGQRAVSIPVDMVKSVSALIQPGDRVDVMASSGASGTRGPRTATIIRGATILAVNQTIDPNAAATPAAAGAPAGAPAPAAAPATVTLAVSAAQADLLTVADLNTTLRLALRSPDEPVGSLPAQPLDLAAAPAAAAPVSGPPPAAAPQQPARGVQAPVDGITFIDGDKTAIIPR